MNTSDSIRIAVPGLPGVAGMAIFLSDLAESIRFHQNRRSKLARPSRDGDYADFGIQILQNAPDSTEIAVPGLPGLAGTTISLTLNIRCCQIHTNGFIDGPESIDEPNKN